MSNEALMELGTLPREEAALDDERSLAPWVDRVEGHPVFELPRLVVARSTGLDHLIHHRGQLSVYLRLLEVPLPPIYGPTADSPGAPEAPRAGGA